VGDLVQFGLPAEEIGHDYLVAGVEPHEDMSATLDLIEYQSGVYGVTGEESYEPHVEDFPPDPKYMDPSSPRVSAIQTDEWALWYGPDGTIDPQILVSVSLWSGAYAPTAYWEAQIRSHIDGQGAENGWRTGGQFEGSSRSLGLRPVLQGHRYDFRLRTRSDHNRVSQWVLWDNSEEGYLVIGKATPPPDPVSMTRDGASVRWGYVMATAPPDMAGFEVRVHAGDNAGWDNAQKLHASVLRAQSFPLTAFGWGVFTFYVKAVDTSGNYSTNAASIAINFGDPIVDNPKSALDWRALDWPDNHLPGEPSYLENCYRHPVTHELVAVDESLPMKYTVSYADGALAGYENAISEHFWKVEAYGDWWEIEYRNAFDTGPEWVPWTSQLRIHGSYACWFRVTIGPSSVRQRLVQFKSYIGTPTMTEQLLNQTLTGTNHAMFWTYPFTHVTGITYTILSGTAVYAVTGTITIGSKMFYITAYKPDGTVGTAVANITVSGYRWLNGPGT
jgi:hypothetical protein